MFVALVLAAAARKAVAVVAAEIFAASAWVAVLAVAAEDGRPGDVQLGLLNDRRLSQLKAGCSVTHCWGIPNIETFWSTPSKSGSLDCFWTHMCYSERCSLIAMTGGGRARGEGKCEALHCLLLNRQDHP